MVEASQLDEIEHKHERRHYLPGVLEARDGDILTRETGDQGSGILLSMEQAPGLAIILQDVDHLAAGARVPVLLLD